MINSDEHRAWLRTILRRAGIPSSAQHVDELATAICASVAAFEAERKQEVSFRESHDALRGILVAALSPDPPVGKIRARVLSGPASIQLKRRAERLWPTIFGAPYSKAAMVAWIENADKKELVDRLPTLLVEGAVIAAGRRRPNGRRSARRIEPVIMGVSRRTGSTALIPRDGRPRAQAVDNLVMYLAIDWLVVTGQSPAAGRSEAKPFGELVHRVFDWLGLTGADQALRRYWTAVARETARARRD